MLEAGVRQFGAWGDTDEGRHILIAVARYLAAHSPTEPASLQTANIARRLMRSRLMIRAISRLRTRPAATGHEGRLAPHGEGPPFQARVSPYRLEADRRDRR